jgi:Tfp pilus assembly protein PilO
MRAKLKLRKLSLADTMLVVAVVVGVAIIFIISQANTNAEQEKTQLELRSQALEVGLNETDRKATLESLRQRLEQLRSTPVDVPLPTRTEATAATDRVLLYARSNNVTITGWDTSYVSITLAKNKYPGIKHSLVVEAGADGLIGFVGSLTQVSPAIAIQNVEVSEITEEEGMWQMDFELIIYFKES